MDKDHQMDNRMNRIKQQKQQKKEISMGWML
jgi:hypothetical protein